MKNTFIAFFLTVVGVFACLNTCLAQNAVSDTFREPEMVLVEGGTYTMGLTKDKAGEEFRITAGTHVTTLSNFYIGKYEVTQAEWQAVMGDSLNSAQHGGCANCPVEGVSWNEIQLYIQKLNDVTGKYYQLPTQAQWEFAARGGKKSRGYKYAGSDKIEEVALLGGGHAQPVGSKKPNELGIYDMTGNVAEWCKDVFKPAYARKSSPAHRYNIRGGSWGLRPEQCQLAKDGSMGYPNDRSPKIGFRLVLIPYIPQAKCFQGDTLKYIKCISERESHYIDKPFYFFLNDLELPLQSFFNGDIHTSKDSGAVTTFAFYDNQTTNTILADLRAKRRRHDIENLVFITIKWKTPLPANIVDSLHKTNGGKLTPAVQEYFRKQIIKDIIIKRFAIVG